MPTINTKSGLVVFEDTSPYDSLTKYVIGGILAVPLILALVFLTVDITGAIAMFCLTVLDALIFWSILPRRYQVYEDRLKIILGKPFSITIPFIDISGVRQAEKEMAYVYWGMRFATSSKFMVEIRRKHGLSVVFSPSLGNIFIENLEQVRQSWINRYYKSRVIT